MNADTARGRRVVLDSNYAGYASRRLLEALRSRGFRLSLSVLAMQEVWARAARDERLVKFASRVRNLTPFVNAEDPLVPVGVELLDRLGGTIRGTVIRGAERGHRQHLQTVWSALAAGRFDASDLKSIGIETDEEIARGARSWLASCEDGVRARDRIGTFAEDEGVRRISSGLGAEMSRHISIHHGLQERFHGYFRLCAQDMVRAAIGGCVYRRPEKNDAEDVQFLMHLGDDVILATKDYDLIERVDATTSFQAPWVMTAGELLSRDGPEGRPWGRGARRAHRKHQVRHRKVLDALERDVEASLGARRATA